MTIGRNQRGNEHWAIELPRARARSPTPIRSTSSTPVVRPRFPRYRWGVETSIRRRQLPATPRNVQLEEIIADLILRRKLASNQCSVRLGLRGRFPAIREANWAVINYRRIASRAAPVSGVLGGRALTYELFARTSRSAGCVLIVPFRRSPPNVLCWLGGRDRSELRYHFCLISFFDSPCTL